ncbi:chemotaxis protein CheW [Paraglaciecola sp. L3A3]|uniref:chemotaxis protein CheW n=1 Tax=Paraglaciecola sp. L3A3 TaxID=2686358 RepID=UPI00131AB63F|nr:chemotaxis protein CheW [Paraglaciecola sp. L3A3]
MASNPFANEDVMDDYMSALLTEEPIADELHRQTVEQLLKTAPSARSEPYDPLIKKRIKVEPIITKVIIPEVEEELTTVKTRAEVIFPVVPETKFQVLLFEVAGMTLAVPLTELGGIHQITNINPLFGKPNWFKGVLLHREEKYNVVDTAKWIMSEKSAEKVAESTKYQYLIVLGESGWGLGCENLITTETLLPDDVKWRNVMGSRPWLSGMIKKKMCALLNVQQMISMLNQGLSSSD